VLEYIRLEELLIVSKIRENSGLYSFDSEFWGRGMGGIENFKNLEEERRKFTNKLNRGPVKI
jgi:hypothetical protein